MTLKLVEIVLLLPRASAVLNLRSKEGSTVSNNGLLIDTNFFCAYNSIFNFK